MMIVVDSGYSSVGAAVGGEACTGLQGSYFLPWGKLLLKSVCCT